MGSRLPRAIFYFALAASALAVVVAGVMACVQEPQVRALVLSYLH